MNSPFSDLAHELILAFSVDVEDPSEELAERLSCLHLLELAAEPETRDPIPTSDGSARVPPNTLTDTS